MDWLAQNWWAGVAGVVGLVGVGVAVHFGRRQTAIAEQEQAARRERDRWTEPPVPSPPAPKPKPKWPLFHNLRPDLHRAIVGREAMLADIDAALARAAGAALTPAAALHAAGGMGKTSLARLYAKERWERFEGVWWLPSEQVEETLVPEIDALGAAIGVKPEGDAKTRVAAIWAALANRDAPWLLVFDNAPSHRDVAPWLAYGAKVKLIVTSREDDFPPDAIPTLPVDALAPEAAAEALEREARREGDREGALRLAEALGFLPLALVQAGAYARETGFSFDECRERIAAICALRPPGDYPDSVFGSLELTMRRVEADGDTGPYEMALLRLMPWLAPEGIDAKLVMDVATSPIAQHETIRPDISPEIRILAGAPDRLHRAMTRLSERALATVSGEGEARRAALHRVTALILRQRFAGEAEALRRAAAAAVAAGYPGEARTADRANWPDCVRLNPHVAALAAPPEGGAPPATAAMEFLLNQSALYWLQHAEAETAARHAAAALEMKIARLGPDDPEVGIAHDTLGWAQSLAGDHEPSVASREAALQIAEAQGEGYALLGTRLSNLAFSLGGLARARGAAGDAAGAAAATARRETLLRRAWKVGRARLPRPTAHNDLAARLNNLGDVYDAQGRRGRAICFTAAALRMRRRLVEQGDYGPRDHRLAVPLNNLGAYRLEAGDAARARPLLEEALEIREDAFAKTHEDRVATARWLASCLFALGEAAEAEALCARYGLDAAGHRADGESYMRRAS